jgi:chondroitin-sulfate-ABC endolyase/exolyase
MNYRCYLLALLLTGGICLEGQAQFYGFEERVPRNIKGAGLVLSAEHYKDGKRSLAWSYAPNDTLTLTVAPLTLTKQQLNKGGLTLWIYNETFRNDSLRIEVITPNGDCAYSMGFALSGEGWRACWEAFRYMTSEHRSTAIGGLRLIAPATSGRIFLDRLTFPVDEVNRRATPDLQTPHNNDLTNPQTAHWCRIWQWEQYVSDIPLIPLNSAQEKELNEVEYRLASLLEPANPAPRKIEKAYEIYKRANIRRSGNTFVGAPLVAPDDKIPGKGFELTLNDIEAMLNGFALDAHINGSQEALNRYFTVWDFALDQGFAYGSGMGTNHHYGYQTRELFSSAFLLRDEIQASSRRDAIVAALTYWSALAETRRPCPTAREGLLDAWHTLLMARLEAALMQPTSSERAQALKGLSRWLSTSLRYTPGTSGGIKPDGTTFHHGGFYPAYTTGMLGILGQYMYLTAGTAYALTTEARSILGQAFTTMINCCNHTEWGIGISGRHPFDGALRTDDITALAYFALAEEAEGNREAARHWASHYLRLSDKITPLTRKFRHEGIAKEQAPVGFFVYNYGATGIFRGNGWTVTLKGYNSDVWGAEIYTRDNRYGRYQSYGSTQIMGEATRRESGYEADGWDWNRLPGVSSIHLPFDLLDSPEPNTLMARSPERFAGASSLDGQCGMFAIKLAEADKPRFTSDFRARKSVFCFDNRMICLGTDITDSNANYATETTLFQSRWLPYKGIWVDDERISELGLKREKQASEDVPVVLRDSYNNWYYVRKGRVCAQAIEQESRDERTKAPTRGTFASAWINHGKAPRDGSYEYLVVIKPDENSMTDATSMTQSYHVVQADRQMHAVIDKASGTHAFAVFESETACTDSLLTAMPVETLILYRTKSDDNVRMSICSPNLNIADKSGSTTSPSRPIEKRLRLKGHWTTDSPNVSVEPESGATILTVNCTHGIPVEFELIKQN